MKKGETRTQISFKTFVNLGIFQFLTFVRRGVFYTFMISYLFILMKTVTSTAALGTLNMVASALGQNLLWGRICDRMRNRTKLIVTGETIAAFAYVVVFLVHRAVIESGDKFSAGLTIIFGLSVLEFFWSMSDVGWAALLTDVTTPSNRGKAVGTLNFIASLGRIVGILSAGLLYNEGEGFLNGTIFVTVSILLLTGATLMWFISRRMRTKYTPQDRSTRSYAGEGTAEPARYDSKKYRWFLISLIVIILGASSINQIFLLFLELPQGLDFTVSQRSLVLSSWTFGGMIAGLGAGKLADRFGRTKVLLMGLILAIFTPLLYSFVSTAMSMAFIYGLNGVSFWIIQTVGFVLAGDLIPHDRRGRLLSRYNTVTALSWGPAGFLLGGPLADLQVGSFGITSYTAYVNGFCISSIIVLLGTLVFTAKVARSKST